MKPTLLFISLFAIALLSSSWKLKNNDLNCPKPEKVHANIYLDSFPAGNITTSQLKTAKTIKVKAIMKDGKTRDLAIAKCSMVFMMSKGHSVPSNLFVEMIGNVLNTDVLKLMASSQPKDIIMVGNLKIVGVDDIVIEPSPMWKVIADE